MFWGFEKWPKAILKPKYFFLRRIICFKKGHVWKPFYYGGINQNGDCEYCTRCMKFQKTFGIKKHQENHIY